MKTCERYIAKVSKTKQGSKLEPEEVNEAVNYRINHNMGLRVIQKGVQILTLPLAS